MSENEYEICPSCDIEIEKKLLERDEYRCLGCGNTDFSEEAKKIPIYHKKDNCIECGKLLDLGGINPDGEYENGSGYHRYNPFFRTGLAKKYKGKFGIFESITLCDEHDISEEQANKQATKTIKKIMKGSINRFFD
jgi:hypothetical protein